MNLIQLGKEVKKEHPEWNDTQVDAEAKVRLAKAIESEDFDKKEVKTFEKETKVVPEDDDTLVIKKSDLKDLFSAYLAENKKAGESENSDETVKLLRELVDSSRSEKYPGAIRTQVGVVRQEDIDLEDFMSDPKLFYSYHGYYSIYGDRRFNQDVATPYRRPIVFKYHSTKTLPGNDKFSNTKIHMSICSIHSKKEYQWMKDSSLSGIEFFETSGSLNGIDVSLASKLSEVNTRISGMSQQEVLSRAEAEGIPLDADVSKVKHALINKLAQDEVAVSRKKGQELARSYHESAPIETNPENYLKAKV